MAKMSDDEVRAVHPKHTAASVAALLKRFHVFEQGNCVVHHMFGADVTRQVREDHADAFVTAHLEVPGEMFALALEKQRAKRGVVGSTSNILGFILDRVREAVDVGEKATLPFVLGTEAGMITPIVRKVQAMLSTAKSPVEVEVIFPVASGAIATTGEGDLPIVPGVAAGEGCTTAGGCATCPYMKMNSLDALLDLCRKIGTLTPETLAPFYPKTYVEMIGGRTAADLGSEPILHMRHFQTSGQMAPALVEDVLTRASA
jgi:quinolinate synthase